METTFDVFFRSFLGKYLNNFSKNYPNFSTKNLFHPKFYRAYHEKIFDPKIGKFGPNRLAKPKT